MGLQRQAVTVKLTGLDTKQVAGTSLPGRLKLAENVMGRKRTDGGVEFIKRYGRTALTKAVTAKPRSCSRRP